VEAQINIGTMIRREQEISTIYTLEIIAAGVGIQPIHITVDYQKEKCGSTSRK
jgi:hypothetical protein